MGQLLVFALSEKRYSTARAILQPLNEFWDARGLAEEAKGWVDRVRQAVESAGGVAPDARALWQFAVSSEVNRAVRSGDLAGAERAYEDIRRTLGPPGEEDYSLAVNYQQRGLVAQHRGDLAAAEAWYQNSLAIIEKLRDYPGMARSYGQLGLLAETRRDLATALDWTVRCVALFPDFPHPSTGPGPSHLARLTRMQGTAPLQESWQRCTGRPLPANIRAGVERMIREADPTEG